MSVLAIGQARKGFFLNYHSQSFKELQKENIFDTFQLDSCHRIITDRSFFL